MLFNIIYKLYYSKDITVFCDLLILSGLTLVIHRRLNCNKAPQCLLWSLMSSKSWIQKVEWVKYSSDQMYILDLHSYRFYSKLLAAQHPIHCQRGTLSSSWQTHLPDPEKHSNLCLDVVLVRAVLEPPFYWVWLQQMTVRSTGRTKLVLFQHQ